MPTGSKFNLFATERKGVALGVLTQPRGPHQQPIAYLSRELDVVSRGWPHCLKVIGAEALLAPEALKINNGRNLTVLTSHDVSGILNSKVNIWMTDSRLFKYQSLLLEGPVTKLKVCGNLNPATFLPEKENETPDHNCSQFLTLNYAAGEDLKDTPLDNPDMKIFTDGSSFVQDGKPKTGYAVVTAEQVLEAKSLPQETSAQLAELVALTQALELSKGQWMGLIIYVSLFLLTPKILSLPLDPQDNVFLSWAHSYAAFHNRSNCWVCGALPSSSVEGFPWWTSALQGKDFLQVCE